MLRSQTIISIALTMVFFVSPNHISLAAQESATIRVPAEWEPQEAIWVQWPGRYEKVYETAFARMSIIISSYQKLHILYHDDNIRDQAEGAISAAGGDPGTDNIYWHHIPNNSAWMRDNGPIYVIRDGEMRIQNWQFNA